VPVASSAPRDEPEVQRFVSVENDLGDVQGNLAVTADIIARLDAVIAAHDHSALYPELAVRRARIDAIQTDLANLRNEIHDHAGVSSPERKAVEAQFVALGNPEQAFADRVGEAQGQFDAVDKSVGEVDATLGSAQAVAVALRKYANDTPSVTADQKKNLQDTLDAAAKDAQAIEDELVDVRREIVLGKDLVSVGDEGIQQARLLRKQLTAAQDNEARSMGSNELAQRAMRLADNLDQSDAVIAAAQERGIEEAKVILDQARKDLVDYNNELVGYEAEAREVGSTVLGASFKDVKAKFYDVIVRTDVGNVDVAWSEKEDTDDDLKRLNLARSRELKQLRDEFKDILDAGTSKPSAPKKSALPPVTEGQSGSPDKGAGDQRVSPGSGGTTAPTSPTVKPDEQKKKAGPAPKTAPKGGSK
jgi:predicted  nucleic acid-binding Zn-ribbon protein